MTADFAVIPRTEVAIAVEHDAARKRADPGDGEVGHADHWRIAEELHRHDDRRRKAGLPDLGVEPPAILADFLDARDLVPIGPERAILAAGNRERADQHRPLHPLGELALGLR